MDRISLDRLALLHPAVRQEAISLYLQAIDKLKPRYNLRVTQGLRTFAEQDALYAQGRTKPGAIVTNAPGGSSYHNYGLALDFCLLTLDGRAIWDANNPCWSLVVDIFIKAGWKWGGDFGDPPHFEKSFNLSVQELKNRYLKLQFCYDPQSKLHYVNI